MTMQMWSLTAAILCFAAGDLCGGPKTYYVSPDGSNRDGDGSMSKPWATPSAALARVPDEGVQIVVRDGLYEGEFAVTRKFTRPVVIRAEHPYRARLRHRHAVLQVRNAANVEIAGFDIARIPPEGRPTPLGAHIARSVGITLRHNLIHDSRNNDLLKINEGASDILIAENIFYNQEGGAGQHIDVNGCRNIFIHGNIFFNDYAGTGVDGSSSHGYIVIKNSGDLPESRRFQISSNIFLNFEGSAGSNFILIGEDAKPFHEAQEILIENNLMIGNSPVRMRAPFGAKGGRDIIFRNNTVTGDLPSSAYGMRLNREGRNPPNYNLLFVNNVWSDPGGTMSNFSDGGSDDIRLTRLVRNAYWNGGKRLPGGQNLRPADDSQAIKGDPRLPWPAKVTLPHWNEKSFWSSVTTFREEFERLVREFGTPGAGSALIGAADTSMAPEFDILGNRRGKAPDVGAVQRDGERAPLSLQLLPGHIYGGATGLVNRVILSAPAPADGTVVKLSASNPVASITREVFIPAGETSTSFSVDTKHVSAETPVTLQAVAGGQKGDATLVIMPQSVVSVNPSSVSVWAGESEHLLMLEGSADGETKVELSSSRPDVVSFPRIEAGKGAYARFTVRAKPVLEETPVMITAALGGRKSSASVTIRPGQAITNLKIDRTHAFNGESATGVVTVAEPASPGQAVEVQLRSEKPDILSVPATVRIPPGELSATFPIETQPPPGRRSAIGVAASVNGRQMTRWLTVGRTEIDWVTVSRPQGRRATGTIRLTSPAPRDYRCSISSSRPDLASVPESVVVPENTYNTTFPVTLKADFSPGDLAITVSCGGMAKTANFK